jgi:outer membrane protein assembly factor BamB
MREHHPLNMRHMRWTLISALFLALTACASQTSSARSPAPVSSPTTYPTLAPWIPTLTPTNVPYSTAVPGTMPHVDGLLYEATMDGNVLAINPATGATKWSVSAGSSAGLLATDHALYAGYGDHLDALRLSDGARLWRVLGGNIIADADGVLYLDRQERITALDDHTGATRWRWTPPSDQYEAGAIAGPGVVIFGTTVSGNGAVGYCGLYALDTRTGALRWQRPRGTATFGNPVIDGERAFYLSDSFAGPSLIGAYALADGKTLWTRDASSIGAVKAGADVIGADDQYVYTRNGEDGDHGVSALKIGDGSVVWTHDTFAPGNGAQHPFRITGGAIYSLTYTNGWSVAAFDAVSGSQRWNQSLDGVFLAAQPLMSGGLIYTSTFSPDVAYALDAATGAIRWRFPAALTGFTVRNGVLFAHVDHDPNAQPQLTTDVIYAINATTGALYWKRDLPSTVASGPFLEP